MSVRFSVRYNRNVYTVTINQDLSDIYAFAHDLSGQQVLMQHYYDLTLYLLQTRTQSLLSASDIVRHYMTSRVMVQLALRGDGVTQ